MDAGLLFGLLEHFTQRCARGQGRGGVPSLLTQILQLSECSRPKTSVPVQIVGFSAALGHRLARRVSKTDVAMMLTLLIAAGYRP